MRDLTICITSCNRLKYLRVLVKSLEHLRDNVQLIIVDTGSTEFGIRDFIKQHADDYFLFDPDKRDWINDEYKARNKHIELTKNELVMYLQDDTQYVATKEVTGQVLDDFVSLNDALCFEIMGVRHQTILSTTSKEPVGINSRKYFKRLDKHFPTTGIYKNQAFKDIGYYPVEWPNKKEFWGRSETWYANEVKNQYPEMNIYRTPKPLGLSIWNDPRGGYAFIRGNKRYGHYLDPTSPNDLYYGMTVDDLKLGNQSVPYWFMQVAKPLGWEVATTANGEQKKWNQKQIVEKDGPFEELP